MIRRYRGPVHNRKYQMRPGAYVILPLGSAILLTHQQEPQPEYQLPGGGIDPGESPLNALHREVMEETGYRFTGPRRLGAFRRFAYMPEYAIWAEKICHIYLARPTLCHGPPSEVGHTAVWAPVVSASLLLAESGSRAFVDRVFK